MTLKIIILVPNGRRKNLNVTPNSVISQTLEDICKRENLDSKKYSFQFQRKILDESLSWRFANVPNNAKLELIESEINKTELPVRIAIQYENERYQNSFLPSTTLWEILSHWEDKLPLMSPPKGEEPSVLYVRQEITGKYNLQSKSLKNLGLTKGSAILKFSLRPQTDQTLSKSSEMIVEVEDCSKTADFEAKNAKTVEKNDEHTRPTDKLMTKEMLQNALDTVLPEVVSTTEKYMSVGTMDISEINDSQNDPKIEKSKQFSEEMELENSVNVQKAKINQERSKSRRDVSKESIPPKKFKPTPPSSPVQDFSEFKFPKSTEGQDLYVSEMEINAESAPSSKPCQREALLYDENQIQSDDNDLEDPSDEFFELTIDDIQKMLADLRYQQRESEEKNLTTSRSREIQKLRAINQYPKIVVRIIFPDRKILQGIFRPAETVEVLYDFVKMYLKDLKTDFYLYTTPPKVILKDRKSMLFDYHLSPASKVYVSLKDREFDSNLLSEKCSEIQSSPIQANLKLKEVLNLRTEPKGEEEANTDSRPLPQTHFSANGEASTSGQSSSSGATRERSSNNSGATPKVPKWFKLGKK